MNLNFEEAQKQLESSIKPLLQNFDLEKVLHWFLYFYKDVDIKGVSRKELNDMLHFSYGNFKFDDPETTFQIVLTRQIQSHGLKQLILTFYYDEDNSVPKHDYLYWMSFWLEDTNPNDVDKWLDKIKKTDGYIKYKNRKPLAHNFLIDII